MTGNKVFKFSYKNCKIKSLKSINKDGMTISKISNVYKKKNLITVIHGKNKYETFLYIINIFELITKILVKYYH